MPSLFRSAFVFLCVICAFAQGPVPGPNVNMVSGTQWPGGDPNLQRQNEPSIAVSTRNPMHLVAGANDYRTVDLAGLLMVEEDSVTPDAWLGLFKSFDGGMTWRSTLLPGCPYNPISGDNPCLGSPVSPLRDKGYTAGADPTVRAGAHGMFYYSFIAFDRNNKSNGALAVASFIDNNNKEAGDTIRYLGTSVVDDNTGGQFADKPYLAVDRPRAGSGSCTISGPGTPTQTLTAGNLYVAYTIFLGNGQNVHSKLMLATSTDCAKTWRQQKLSEGNLVNQGATIAIDPDTGAVYVAWRRFNSNSETDAMVIVKSTDGGQKFSKAQEIVPSIYPFDQKTSQTAIAFRTNSYPTMAAINGRLYIAWADRVTGPAAEARIVLYSSADGLTWRYHGVVDPPDRGWTALGPRGNQLMPALTAAGGKLTLVYYDLREDHTAATYDSTGQNLYTENRAWAGSDLPANVFKSGVADQSLLRRHTIDVRVVQMTVTSAGPGSPSPARVSQYAFGSTDSQPNLIRQLGFNPPNLPIFRKGTVPFFGDYIDVAALQYVPDSSGWIANTADSNSTVFHAAWTDNRNVYPGDVTKYAPPGSGGGASLFDPTQSKPACVAGTSKTGVLNQDVYTARITQGLVVGSYGNAKPLSTTLQRAFSFFVQNTRKLGCTSYRLTIVAPSGVQASFKDLSQPALLTLNVTIGPKSSIARSVFVKSLTAKASVRVRVQELDVAGCAPLNLPSVSPKYNGLEGSAVLNPEIENPEIENPEIENPTPIATSEVYNPEIENPEIENPEIENPEIENPEIENPEIENVEVANPEIENPEIENPEIENPEIENPEIENIPPDGKVSDVSWKVTNKGNTATSYNAKLLAGKALPNGLKLQLLVHKLYRTPVADPKNSCTLKVQTQNAVLVNIPNPVFTAASGLENPEIENPAVTNGSFSLAPGETAKITLRFLDPVGKTAHPTLCGPAPLPACVPGGGYNPTDEIQPVPVPLPPAPPGGPSLPLVITTLTLPDGVRGQSYGPVTLQTVGGTPLYARAWSVTSGSLPTGLNPISGTGVISGTPTATGTSYFVAKVAESCTLPCQPQDDTQGLTLRVFDPLVLGALPNGTFGTFYSSTISVSGGFGPYTFALTSGSLPPGLTLVNGVLSGGPTAAGTYNFTVTATDSASPPQTAPRSYSVTIARAGTAITGITDTPDPSLTGDPVAVSFSVIPAAATGTFSVNDGFMSCSGTIVAGTGSCSLNPAFAGAKTLTITYGGDVNYFGSSQTEPHQVNARTATTFLVYPNPAVAGGSVMHTATVTTLAPDSGTPTTGSVSFKRNGLQWAVATLNAAGQASAFFSVPVGVYTVTAEYQGTTGYGGSTSAPMVQQVNPSPPPSPLGYVTFVTQPGHTAANQIISPAVRVLVTDSSDAVLPGVTVTMAIGNNPAGGTLSGGTSATTDAVGVATFSSLRIDNPGLGYTLVATSGVSGTSVPFHIGLYAGSTSDPNGDSPGGSPDFVGGSAAVLNGNLHLSVRFGAPVVPATTSVTVFLDTDQNASTGLAGVNTGGTWDGGIIGSEYTVLMGGQCGGGMGAGITRYNPDGSWGGYQGATSTIIGDRGMDFTIPLSALGNDDGKLNFKGLVVTWLGGPPSCPSTAILDVMPNVGTAATIVQ